jgi:hypothetical protein
MKVVSRERGWRSTSHVRLSIPTAPGSAAVILGVVVNDEFADFVDVNPASFFARQNGA